MEPELKALAQGSAPIVAAADAAAQALSDALAARDAFRLNGERKKIFDAFNSLAATTYGTLQAFAHAHPELRLSSNYADTFFLHDLSSTPDGTVSATAKQAEQAQAKAAAAQAKHDAALKKEADKKAAAAERAAAKAKIALAKKGVADAKKAVAAAKKKKPATAKPAGT